MTRHVFFATLIAAQAAAPASAHIGHLGEVAGHGHWIGLGLIAGAGILAGWLGTGDMPEAETDEDETPETEECPAGCEA